MRSRIEERDTFSPAATLTRCCTVSMSTLCRHRRRDDESRRRRDGTTSLSCTREPSSSSPSSMDRIVAPMRRASATRSSNGSVRRPVRRRTPSPRDSLPRGDASSRTGAAAPAVAGTSARASATAAQPREARLVVEMGREVPRLLVGRARRAAAGRGSLDPAQRSRRTSRGALDPAGAGQGLPQQQNARTVHGAHAARRPATAPTTARRQR